MDLKVSDEITISDISQIDKSAYLEHLQEKTIYDQTLTIPYPYTDADADWWIAHIADETLRQGRSVNWAIRRRDGYLIGGIGFNDLEYGKSHRAEMGYWLAKPYWGHGIMTACVKAISDFAFAELSLVRVTADVFASNAASARVLEKAGFHLEGTLRNYYKKDGRVFDGKLFARVREK